MPTGVTNPHRGRKTRLVSLLESLYRRSAASGANASRVRAGNPRLDEAGRWKREAEIEQATGSPPQGELGQRSSSMKAMHQRTMLPCSALSAVGKPVAYPTALPAFGQERSRSVVDEADLG